MNQPDVPLEKEEIFLDKLLIDIMSEFQLVIDKEDRDIQISVQPESAKIISNYDKLSRIILNLVSNALMQLSKVSVWLSVLRMKDRASSQRIWRKY